jgi:hypothetical protein
MPNCPENRLTHPAALGIFSSRAAAKPFALEQNIYA